MNTTTAQQSGPSDAAIAQAFREYCYNFPAAKISTSHWVQNRAADIDARQLQAAGGDDPADHDGGSIFDPPAGSFVVDEMVNRFLCWPLPKDFAPDAGISFTPGPTQLMPLGWPVGTNLFTADQAKAMFLHCAPTAQPSAKDGVRGDAAPVAEVIEIAQYPDDYSTVKWLENPPEAGTKLYTHPATTASGLVDGFKGEHAFKNFHSNLCKRFGYSHDDEFWWRDLVSLEEYIATKISTASFEAQVTDEIVERAGSAFYNVHQLEWTDQSIRAALQSVWPGQKGEGFPPAAVWNDQYQGWVIPKRHGLTVLCEQSAIVWNECRELCLAATQPPAGTAQGDDHAQ